MNLKPCNQCGVTGLHACMGKPSKPWTDEDSERFELAMIRVHELRDKEWPDETHIDNTGLNGE